MSDSNQRNPEPNEIVAYYSKYPEEQRLLSGCPRLEFERTKQIIRESIPNPPCVIVDIGGGAGVYSGWLAELGYEVHLLDLSPRLIEEARKYNITLKKPIASMTVSDARSIPMPDAKAGAVLLMGPIYHLTEQSDRLIALSEANRLLSPSGILIAAAISRFASTLDGLTHKRCLDPVFTAIRNQDLVDGQHRNPSGKLDYFTNAYFHRPNDLEHELKQAKFQSIKLVGVEGPGWLLSDFDARWEDPALRNDLIDIAHLLESEPSVLGISTHLLGIGRKPAE